MSEIEKKLLNPKNITLLLFILVGCVKLNPDDNISTFGMNYSFENISDKQTKCMIHFLENKGGYRRFEHQIPSVYNRPKVYYSPKWSHTWNYSDSNKLTVDLVEDPLGVIPTGT